MKEMRLSECFVSVNYWLLFACFAVSTGSALMLCNNIAQLDKSLRSIQLHHGEVSGKEAIFLALFSIGSTIARLSAGSYVRLLKERFFHSNETPAAMVYSTGPFLLVLALTVNSFCFFSLSMVNWYGTVAITLFVGFCYGCSIVLMVVTTNDLFGKKHMGSNVGFQYAGTMFVGIVLSQFIAAPIYERHALEQANGGDFCTGKMCFSNTFVLTGLILALGIFCGMALLARVRLSIEKSSYAD